MLDGVSRTPPDMVANRERVDMLASAWHGQWTQTSAGSCTEVATADVLLKLLLLGASCKRSFSCSLLQIVSGPCSTTCFSRRASTSGNSRRHLHRCLVLLSKSHARLFIRAWRHQLRNPQLYRRAWSLPPRGYAPCSLSQIGSRPCSAGASSRVLENVTCRSQLRQRRRHRHRCLVLVSRRYVGVLRRAWRHQLRYPQLHRRAGASLWTDGRAGSSECTSNAVV